MRQRLLKLRDQLNEMGLWLIPLFFRLIVGFVFAQSGWGKLQHIEGTVKFFTDLGIPYPQIQAPMVAGLELVCGLLIIFGLLTRLVSVPLIVIMIVALKTATEAASLADLPGHTEFLYAALLLALVFSGPGRVSLDQLISKRLGLR